MCPCALVPHKGGLLKGEQLCGLAPWSEETVMSCHALTVVPRATDRTSLQRPRIYSPPRWDQHRGHFPFFRAVSSTYGGRVKRPSVSQGQPTLHRDHVFLRGDNMIYACYPNVAGLSPWWRNYGLEPFGGLITPFPVSPLLAPATNPEGGITPV